MDKLKKIAELLDGKLGYFSAELHGNSGNWYVECWTDGKRNILHNGYSEDLEATIDEIITKLGGIAE